VTTTSRFDHAAMLAKDERKAAIEINTTPVIEAMSAHHKVGDGRTRHAGATVPEKAFEPEYILVAR
jgi:hypothetical protein